MQPVFSSVGRRGGGRPLSVVFLFGTDRPFSSRGVLEVFPTQRGKAFGLESPRPGAVAIPVLNPDGSSTAIASAVPKLHGGYEIAAPKASNPDGTYGASIQIPVPNLDDTHPDGHCPRISIPIIPLVNMDGHPAIAIAMPNLDGEGYEIQRHPKGGHVAVPNFDVEGIQGIASSVFCTGSACQGSNWWR